MFRSREKHFTPLLTQAPCAEQLSPAIYLLKYEGKGYINKVRQIRCFCVHTKGDDGPLMKAFSFVQTQENFSSKGILHDEIIIQLCSEVMTWEMMLCASFHIPLMKITAFNARSFKDFSH